MTDRISNYRQVRLILDLCAHDEHDIGWSLHATEVKKGVPHTSVLDRGRVPNPGYGSAYEDLLGALAEILDSRMIH